MRGSSLVSLVLAGGCAINGGIRTEQVGTGHGTVSTRAAGASEVSAAPGGGGMPLSRGTYDFELRIGVPRAQLVDWKVTCTGTEERQGQVGQAFEDYKEHRLAQLTREREQQATLYARAVTPPNVVVVARPPVARVPVGRIGSIEVQPAPVVVRDEPPAQGNVDVEVPPVTELPPGDYGQGTFPARVRVVMPADGVCAITALADDPGVNAFYAGARRIGSRGTSARASSACGSNASRRCAPSARTARRSNAPGAIARPPRSRSSSYAAPTRPRGSARPWWAR